MMWGNYPALCAGPTAGGTILLIMGANAWNTESEDKVDLFENGDIRLNGVVERYLR